MKRKFNTFDFELAAERARHLEEGKRNLNLRIGYFIYDFKKHFKIEGLANLDILVIDKMNFIEVTIANDDDKEQIQNSFIIKLKKFYGFDFSSHFKILM